MAAMRPYRSGDAEAIAALTLAAIRTSAPRAYSPAPVAAWAERYSVEGLLEAATRGDAIPVTVDEADRPLAYAVLAADGHLAMLYCHPDHAGRGLGRALLAEADQAARAGGIARLFTEASELARPVFARAGYRLLHRHDFAIPTAAGEVAIHNYAMEKPLA